MKTDALSHGFKRILIKTYTQIVTTLRISPSKYRFAIATIISLLFHGLILCMLLWTPPDRLRGVKEGALQCIMQQSHGIEAIGVAIELPKPNEDRISKPSPEKQQTVKNTKPNSQASKIPVPEPKPPQEDTATPTETGDNPTTEQTTTIPEVDTAIMESNPAFAATQGGDINGNITLLEQIARCLPPDVRPSLPNALLNISLDEMGNLIAAPTLQADIASMSVEEIKSANLVVQATLMCAPYLLPDKISGTYSFIPDFKDTDLISSKSSSHGKGQSF